MHNNNDCRLPFLNSRQMTGLSLDQCLDHDLRGLAEETPWDARNNIAEEADGYLPPLNSSTTTSKKKKQRPLSLPRPLAAWNFDQQAMSTTSAGRKRVSLTRSLSMLIRRLRPSLRWNKESKETAEVESIFTYAGKPSNEQQQHYSISSNCNDNINDNDNGHKEHYPQTHTLSRYDSIDDLNITVAPPLISAHNNRTPQSKSASIECSSSYSRLLFRKANESTTAASISESDFLVNTIDHVSLSSQKQSHPHEALLKINNTTQQQRQPQIKRRESRSSSIASKAASRSSTTINSIYNTFSHNDDEDGLSLFELQQNNKGHARLSMCSSKLSIACCIDGKQSQLDLSQQSNKKDEVNAEKQQAIVNRDAPNERRPSRSSSIALIYPAAVTCSGSSADANVWQQNEDQIDADDEDGENSDNNTPEKNDDDDDDGFDDRHEEAAAEYIKLTAKRLWNEDEGACERERIAEWLGTNDGFRSNVLRQYMSYFDFTGQKIDESFRKLCRKIYFKAEAQQIDRILEVFACRYQECNPSTIMQSADVIHAVAMSLVLLNTDLHGAHENHKKMTRAKYISNTMTTIRDVITTTSPGKPTARTFVDAAVVITSDTTSSSSTNDNGNDKAARRRGLLPLSESVLSIISSASNASSRWMLRRSMSSKSVNSIPPPGTTTAPNEAHRQQPSSSKRNSISSNNNEIVNSNNDAEQQNSNYNSRNRFGSIDEQRSWSEDMENLLKDLYISVKGNQIIQNNRIERASSSSHDDWTDTNTASPTNKDIDSNKFKAVLRRHRGQSLLLPLAGLSGALDDLSLIKLKRRLSHSPTDPSIYALDKKACKEANTTTVSTSYNNIRMCKEGIVMQKHVMEHATKKARHRAWQPCFLVVHGGKADLCRPQSSVSAKEQKRKSLWGSQHKYSHSTHKFYHERESILCDSNNSDNNNNAKRTKKDHRIELLQTIDLKHSVANILPPPGWHGGRRHVFSLQTSDGAVWLFESVDAESTVAWVTCCNYWAALLSKEALPGAICNLDYGWWNSSNSSNLLLYNNSDTSGSNGVGNDNSTGTDGSMDVVISDWTPPSPSMIASQLSETEKANALEKHIGFLQQEIKDHRLMRESIYKRFAGRNNKDCELKKSKALDNWERKMQYLLHEVIKFRTYVEALMCSPRQFINNNNTNNSNIMSSD